MVVNVNRLHQMPSRPLSVLCTLMEAWNQSGPDHAKVFTVEAQVGETVIGQGTGPSKKAAEQEAAFNGIRFYQQDSTQGE